MLFFLAQPSLEKHLLARRCAQTMPALPAEVVTNLPQGWELKWSGKAPCGRAEWSLHGENGCLRRRWHHHRLAEEPRQGARSCNTSHSSLSGSQRRLHNLRGWTRKDLGWRRSARAALCPCSSAGCPSDVPPLFLTMQSLWRFQHWLEHAWRDLNIDEPPSGVHADRSQRTACVSSVCALVTLLDQVSSRYILSAARHANGLASADGGSVCLTAVRSTHSLSTELCSLVRLAADWETVETEQLCFQKPREFPKHRITGALTGTSQSSLKRF